MFRKKRGFRISVDLTFKICILGDAGVGKTSLIHRYCTHRFEINVEKTIGVDISVKKLNISGMNILIQIWDFVGDARFKFLLPTFMRGVFGAIFMYDITRESTFKSLDEWLNTFKPYLTKNEKQIPILIVGGKLDLHDKRIVSIEDVINLPRSCTIYDFIECSAKTGQNVEKIFSALTCAIIKDVGFI